MRISKCVLRELFSARKESISLIEKNTSCDLSPWTYRSISTDFVHQISWELFVNEQSFKFRY